jgi:hypothetical protein
VSLRTDFHAAYDELAPPMNGLPERLVQVVLAENPSRGKAERSISSFSVPVALVAVFLLIAMVAGILIGGRLIRDWSTFHNAEPAGSLPGELAQLEARPLLLPSLKSDDPCPTAPGSAIYFFGSGPAYGAAPLATYYSYRTGWGDYWKMEILMDADVNGLVLVRARDLRTHQPVIFVGPYSGGPEFGTDTVNGVVARQHLELVLDPSHPQLNEAGLQLMWEFVGGLASGYSACTFWQLDGSGFTETYVASGQSMNRP